MMAAILKIKSMAEVEETGNYLFSNKIKANI